MPQDSPENPQVIPSRLLSLPAEIRCKIWSSCIPLEDVLEVRLCADRSLEQPQLRSMMSPVARMFQQLNQLQAILTELGLKLRLINQQIRAESLPLFAAKTVRFCCRACLGNFLKHMRKSGVGIFWMGHIEVVVDLTLKLERSGYQTTLSRPASRPAVPKGLLRTILHNEMVETRKIVHAYYGRLDLMDREVWEFGDEVDDNSQNYVISAMLRV